MNNDNQDTSSGTTGLLGKFRQRINQIRREKALKQQRQQDEQKEFVEEKVKEIKDYIEKEQQNTKLVIVRRTNHKKGIFIKKDQLKEETKEQKQKDNYKEEDNNYNKDSEQESIKETKDKTIIPNHIKNINKGIFRNHHNNNQTQKEETPIKDSKEEKKDDKYLEELKERIIAKIKNDFSKKLAELEVLENELYNLKESTEYEIELEKIKDIKEKINETIQKINEIIAEYNIYRTSYDLGNVIDLNDTLIIDDIIEYRHLVENNSFNKNLIKEYKLLKEYQELYNKLTNIKAISDELIDNYKDKKNELEEKDTKYKSIKYCVGTLDNVMDKCDNEINEQNARLEEIMSKINDITREEITRFRFNGLNNIINGSLQFIATMTLSKRMPVVPRIFIGTMAVNRLARNMLNSMTPERSTEIHYSAINYDEELKDKINDIDYTSKLVSDTLSTINNIKSEFLAQYNSQIPGYSDTLTKLNKIEELVINNQYKIETIKTNLSKGRQQNQEKMLKLENLKKNSQIN
ncbi:MAG: hypothetical protein VZS44_05860 [Bacilli bacterium]|nr:hypothetical protein [Bacilli bacterium]